MLYREHKIVIKFYLLLLNTTKYDKCTSSFIREERLLSWLRQWINVQILLPDFVAEHWIVLNRVSVSLCNLHIPQELCARTLTVGNGLK